MKKTIILATIFLLCATIGQGQVFNQTCRDTVNGISPDYFKFFDPDAWLDSPDSSVTIIEMTEIDRYYDSVNGVWVSVMGYAPVKIPLIYELKHSISKSCRPSERHKEMWYHYTDHPIFVKGLAGVITPHYYNYEHYPESSFWSHFCGLPPDTAEHLYFYDARPDTLICMQDLVWDMETPCKYFKARMRHTPNNTTYCCEYDIADTVEVFPLREFYFDTPTLVKDSFYIGFSTFSQDVRRAPNWPDTEYVAAYYTGYHFGSDGIPGCAFEICHKKCLSLLDNSWFGTKALQWYDFYTTLHGEFPMMWAIYEDACPMVSDIQAERHDASSTTITWSGSQYSTRWELIYGPYGTPDDSCTWVDCPTPSYMLTNLDSTITYKIKLRAQCHIDTLYYSEWDSIRIENGAILNIPIVPSEELKVKLMPNPAREEVTISSSATMRHIELFSINGIPILENNVDDHRVVLRLQNIDPGNYIVRILTDKGMVSKKLVVK